MPEGEGLAAWEIAVARQVARECLRRYRVLERIGFDDLVQDGLAHWIVVRTRLEPRGDQPPAAYMRRVLRNHVLDAVRQVLAGKREGYRDTVPLNEETEGLDGHLSWADRLDGEDLNRRAQGTEQDIQIDLIRALHRLSDTEQQLCVLIGLEGLSIVEAAQRMGRSRASLYLDLKRIRAVFAELGLAIYLRD